MLYWFVVLSFIVLLGLLLLCLLRFSGGSGCLVVALFDCGLFRVVGLFWIVVG